MALDDSVRLTHMLEAIEQIKMLRDDAILPRRIRLTCLIWNIVIIGEAANRLSAEARDGMPLIPWKQIILMRNKLVHAYHAIRVDLVEEVAGDRVNELEQAIIEHMKLQEGID
jgi:uncharacterized protein with HEPN domain